MTTFDSALVGASSQPPHFQQFSNPVRYGAAALMAVLAGLCYIFDFPFAQVGVFQPMMYALGLVIVCLVIDVPFKKLDYQLGMIGFYLVAAATAWAAWYSGGSWISQDVSDLIWKLAALFIFFFTIYYL